MDRARRTPLRRGLVALALTVTVVVGGCASSGSPSELPRSSSAPARDRPAARGAEPFAGAWEGDLIDPSGGFPIRISLDGCATQGEVCGELEYGDPSGADQVFCASELTRTGLKGGVLALRERIVYHPWACMEAAFEVHPAADGGLEIEQIVGEGEVCCQGTLAYIGETLPAAPAADLGGD